MPNSEPDVNERVIEDPDDVNQPPDLHRILTGSRVEPGDAVHWMIHAHRYSQLLCAMATFGLAEKIGDTRASADALARDTGVGADAMRRLLRGLAWCGVVRDLGGGDFALTASGRCLLPRADGSLHDDAVHAGTMLYSAWGALAKGLAGGQVPFDAAFGRTFFEELERDAAAGVRFDRVMQRVARRSASALASSGLLHDASLIVDVGGGSGAMLARLLVRVGGARGIVFDRARTEQAATEHLARFGLADRCSFVSGDFFEAVPGGGDVYLLQRILHDWDDADCERILTRVAAALAPGGRVLVLEEVISERAPATEDHAIAIDMAMLVVTGGRERTEAEYETLARNAGLTLSRRESMPGGLCVLEFTR